jgi:hypothetical protein
MIYSFILMITCFWFHRINESVFVYKNIVRTCQSLVDSEVIDAELGRENHSSIPRNYDQRGWIIITWYQNWPLNQIKLMVEKKKVFASNNI